MEGNSDQGKPSAVPDGSSGDWRTLLQPDARRRITNKIMDTLKRHLPISVPEGLNELQKIAIRFEEKIYAEAANQSDYLRKISLKMMSMESKSQHFGGPGQMIPSTSNNLYGNQNPVDPEMASDSDEHDEFSEERDSSDDTSHDSLQSESGNSGLTGDMIARKRNASEFASGSNSRKKDRKVTHLSSSLQLLAETISLRTAAKRELQDAQKHSQESAQKEADAYSITSCMDILNGIPDVSIKAYIAACDRFRDPAWRNMFVKMPDHRRLQWLELLDLPLLFITSNRGLLINLHKWDESLSSHLRLRHSERDGEEEACLGFALLQAQGFLAGAFFSLSSSSFFFLALAFLQTPQDRVVPSTSCPFLSLSHIRFCYDLLSVRLFQGVAPFFVLKVSAEWLTVRFGWMEGNSDQGKPSAVPDGSSGDWMILLQPDARRRIANNIMDGFKRHLSTTVPEGLNGLQKIAFKFEKIYAEAANQSDHLRKTSLKMLMEVKSQHFGGPGQMIPSTSNNLYGNQNPVDPEMASDSDEHDEFSEERDSSDDTSHDSLQSESGNSGLTGDMIARKRNASEFASGSNSRKKDRKVTHLSSSLQLLAETISLRTAAKQELQDAQKHSQESAQKEADAYSITSCMDILNSIPDVSIKAYLAACDRFCDPAWRDMFVKMPDHRRLQWLELLALH
ncbi:uncharacterized protein LOC141835605 [Curcuma longa]|uniref:uncharacterized protein LOC141835605 n=1 Tax=Curcuma longa TaxID=136217 RepID=UPI003D9F3C0A